MTKPDPLTIAMTAPVTVEVPFETEQPKVKPLIEPYVHPKAKMEDGQLKTTIALGVKVTW
jgi:hypothetical protein